MFIILFFVHFLFFQGSLQIWILGWKHISSLCWDPADPRWLALRTLTVLMRLGTQWFQHGINMVSIFSWEWWLRIPQGGRLFPGWRSFPSNELFKWCKLLDRPFFGGWFGMLSSVFGGAGKWSFENETSLSNYLVYGDSVGSSLNSPQWSGLSHFPQVPSGCTCNEGYSGTITASTSILLGYVWDCLGWCLGLCFFLFSLRSWLNHVGCGWIRDFYFVDMLSDSLSLRST